MSTAAQKNNVLQLPTRFNRMASSDRLMEEWFKAQEIIDKEKRVIELARWRRRAFRHYSEFN